MADALNNLSYFL